MIGLQVQAQIRNLYPLQKILKKDREGKTNMKKFKVIKTMYSISSREFRESKVLLFLMILEDQMSLSPSISMILS